jgi:hypothetical protein
MINELGSGQTQFDYKQCVDCAKECLHCFAVYSAFCCLCRTSMGMMRLGNRDDRECKGLETSQKPLTQISRLLQCELQMLRVFNDYVYIGPGRAPAAAKQPGPARANLHQLPGLSFSDYERKTPNFPPKFSA